jgi:hypothetical protein
VQRKIILISLLILTVLAMSSCDVAQETALPEDPGAKVTAAVQTVYAQVTLTYQAAAAMATATPTITPEPTQTPTLPPPTETPTNVFVGTLTSAPADNNAADNTVNTQPQPTLPQPSTSQNSGSEIPCLRANLEYETYPDGSERNAGTKFTKLWRIKNTGSCTWNGNYSARFVDGDLMGAGATIPFPEGTVIPTNGYLMLEIEFTAPLDVGTYRSNWMLVSDDARLFGLGPNSKGWFWVEIKVVNPDV